MKKNTLFTFILFFVLYNLRAQIPHLSGTVNVSIKSGVFKCDFVLSNIPKIEDYTIMINAGFNLAYMRDSTDRINYYYEREYNDRSSFEAFQYYITGNKNTGRFLPKALHLSYAGAFPAVTDTAKMYDAGDWKGNIAFNNMSVRAAEQTAWYPILYDVKTDTKIDKYTYDITVKCDDCDAIYMNGDIPKKGIDNAFSSKIPVELMLFAGNYDFQKTGGSYFINPGISPEQEQLLGTWTSGIIQFYENNLKIPYGNSVCYLEAAPVVKKTTWMFVTYPTIAVMGNDKWNMKNLFGVKNSLAIDTANIPYIAHELGHYYFGTLTSPNSSLKWLFLEGITEYISLQYDRQKLGAGFYKKAILKKITSTKSIEKLIPISAVTDQQISDAYRYHYIPLLLTALEKQIGMQKMWDWLSFVAKDKNATTDYAYFKNSLLKSGVSAETFKAFEQKYITGENAVTNVIEAVQK